MKRWQGWVEGGIGGTIGACLRFVGVPVYGTILIALGAGLVLGYFFAYRA